MNSNWCKCSCVHLCRTVISKNFKYWSVFLGCQHPSKQFPPPLGALVITPLAACHVFFFKILFYPFLSSFFLFSWTFPLPLFLLLPKWYPRISAPLRKGGGVFWYKHCSCFVHLHKYKFRMQINLIRMLFVFLLLPVPRVQVEYRQMTIFVSMSPQTIYMSGLDPHGENMDIPVRVLDCDTITQVGQRIHPRPPIQHCIAVRLKLPIPANLE